MTLHRIKSAPIILVEDDQNQNILPLLKELTEHHNHLKVLCFEQPCDTWKCVFNSKPSVSFYEKFSSSILNGDKAAVLIDSVNQMSLQLGWNNCLNVIRTFQKDSNIAQLILVLHTDCLQHLKKLQTHLNHIASAIVTYNKSYSNIFVQIKKAGKIIKSEESLVYDSRTRMLKCTPIVKEVKKEDEPERPQPEHLTTFKIEVDGMDKIQKSKLKLPYMSKINEGQSKVYYEPDAVDDWDDEDPDDDLDI